MHFLMLPYLNKYINIYIYIHTYIYIYIYIMLCYYSSFSFRIHKYINL